MKPSNDPFVALAQEWIGQLDTWVDTHGLCGYDPFDVKQHPFIRNAQSSYFKRKLTSGLCDLAPYASRRLLKIAPTENAKSHALMALGRMRLYELDEGEEQLELAKGHLAWLKANALVDFGGLCWGYPFSTEAKGLVTTKDTPVLVVSAIAGEAFLAMYALTKEEEYLADARRIAQFILDDLPRMEQGNGQYCFSYTPGDRRRVHNANLMAVHHLMAVAVHTDEDDLREAAAPALAYTLGCQHTDGAWYYGEWDETEPFEQGILNMIDHHHTGFVLRSLSAIHDITGDKKQLESIRKGFTYFRNYLTEGEYCVPVNSYGKYPIDIHACAEGILCPSVLTGKVMIARGMAGQMLRWTHWEMRDKKTGAPYYRKYPKFKSKLICPRWGVAWMFRAMAEYLYVHYKDGE
mgnify:CR=1 FL=1